jgi:hypothetical protein
MHMTKGYLPMARSYCVAGKQVFRNHCHLDRCSEEVQLVISLLD